MRNAADVISRTLVMTAVSWVAVGFERTKAIAWLEQEGITSELSASEKRFVIEGIKVYPDRFRYQIEGMLALAWELGIANEIDFAKDCDDQFVTMVPDSRSNESGAGFRRKVRPRSLEEVIAACDLAFCLHWVIRDAELTGKQYPLKVQPYFVIERRRALEWLLSDDEWDEVSLDT